MISVLSDIIAQKEAKLLEAEDLVHTANDETKEEKIARDSAEEEVRKLKKEYERMRKKYLDLKKSNSDKNLELKKNKMTPCYRVCSNYYRPYRTY